MSYQKIKIMVGLFVISVLIGLIALSFYVLKNKGVFEEKSIYHFYAQSAESFSTGMPILLSGFQVGEIETIELTQKGLVHITFSVNETNRRWIRKEAKLLLKKPLIGSPRVELITDLTQRLLSPGETLNVSVTDDINDTIAKLEPSVKELSIIIKNISAMTQQLAGSDSPFMQSIDNISQITHKLASEKALINTLTGNQDDAAQLSGVIKQTNQLLKKLNTTTQNLNTVVQGLDQSIVQPSNLILLETQKIMQDINQKLQAIDKTVKVVGNADQDILILKDQLIKSIEKTNHMIDQVDYLLHDEDNLQVELP